MFIQERRPSIPALRVSLKLGALGHHASSVVVDGRDITNHVRAVSVNACVGDLTLVRFELINVAVDVEADACDVGGIVIPLADLES